MASEGRSAQDLVPFSIEDPFGHGVTRKGEERLLRRIHDSRDGRKGRSMGRSGHGEHPAGEAPNSSELAQASASAAVASAYGSERKRIFPSWVTLLLVLAGAYLAINWVIPELESVVEELIES